ncbi:hypothetical protein [Deinococcus sp.]|uniref:hypothetical protein n=1 Tax=Deinococcus sp. TaxID=47478 RepID=UPI003C7E6DC1
MRENPKVQDMLSRNGKLENILSNNAKAKLTPQQNTSVPEIYNVDYSTVADKVATYEYAYAEAVMSCNQTFINDTTLEIKMVQNPTLDYRESIANANVPGTYSHIRTNGSLEIQPERTYCSAPVAFIALSNSGFGVTPADCIGS